MITSELKGEVEVLTLDRSPVNAFNFGMLERVTEAIFLAPQRAAAVLLTGSGNCFTAGLDIKMFNKLSASERDELQSKLDEIVDAFALCPIPIAAAINGHAIGLGAILIALADYRVASQGELQIFLPEVKVGLVLPQRVHNIISRLVGSRRADRLIVEGFTLSSEQALAWGYLDELLPAEGLMQAADAWCRNILALPREIMLETRAQARADIRAIVEKTV